ncbi:YHYH domain-containing protein [Rhizobium leguminosarum]|uniref:YHYH domain-containing protein n=1 Tax=Rhizobium leguminosarum TaxID=384 RepID=UPI001C98D652|nr:YHYH domain-containing protein [Rhizobium leguminosarum]MBY5608841.1 YHYH domain-containing protein [Rhizobium leguminosarum]MBY5646383.1 YHYH domain-containing protein [Rhizobium leguminosarum]MBY5657414.1 YHYH domain-containing protein [Rhizobium leguminosarum]MBY5668691.1 YHYH domain-containing protein [Rhizobium leguminosarum]
MTHPRRRSDYRCSGGHHSLLPIRPFHQAPSSPTAEDWPIDAPSGGTDGNGCHTNHKTGGYHSRLVRGGSSLGRDARAGRTGLAARSRPSMRPAVINGYKVPNVTPRKAPTAALACPLKGLHSRR